MTRDTHTLCRAFGSGSVTTSFNDFGLSWLGFERLTFPLLGERYKPLRHRRGSMCLYFILKQFSLLYCIKKVNKRPTCYIFI